MIETALSAVAKKAAAAAVRPVWTRVSDAAFGTPQERALARVYRLSVAQAVGEVAEEGLDPILVDLAESQFCWLVFAVPDSDLQLVAAPDEASTAAIISRWRDTADSLGIQTATMSVDFDRCARALLRILPEQLSAAAGEPGSPLTGRRLMETLNAVRALVAVMAAVQAASLNADQALETALTGAERICRASHRALRRPDMLYALLRMRSGAAVEALNAAGPGAAQGLREHLEKGFRGLGSEADPVADVNWRLLPEFSLAQQIACEAGLAEVSDACLLLAMLDDSCDSRTIADLRHGLGPGLAVVEEAARNLLFRRRPGPTPGSPLGGWKLS